MKLTKLAGALAVAGIITPGLALATNGYFSHGYGMKAKGMGGTATAIADDAFGGANNPATMVFAGSRLDIGLDWFSPHRDISRSGSTTPGGDLNGSATSGSNNFLIPELGYNRMLNPNMSLGITIYGNGGMNTDYPGGQIAAGNATCGAFNPSSSGPYNMLCGSGRLGVDLTQLIVAPTFAFKINDKNAIGIAPLFGFQQFRAEGLQAFAGFSTDPSHVSNNGYDTATGWGARVGWYGKLSDRVSLGLAYASKIDMSRFDKYRGLFADNGKLDIPSNWDAGIAVKATSALTVAVDYQHINYSEVPAINNPSTNGNPGYTNTLGGSNGRGFGWKDVDVFKLGLEYQYSPKLTLRGGYNHGNNPIQARDVTFNLIAPGVIEDHLTLGMTYRPAINSEVTVAYMHAFQNSVSGSSLFNTWTGNTAGTEKQQMYEDSLGIAYGLKF
ncbi:MAG: outer membrane protein transport protein [Gammaproteobacteria bacterium]